MFLTLLPFLPAAACLFWMLFHWLIASRTDTFWLITALLGVTAVFLYTEACYTMPQTSYDSIITNSLMAQLVAPSVIPFCWMYLERLKNRKKNSWEKMIWIILPVSLFAASAMVLAMTRRSDIVELLQNIYSNGFSSAEAYSGTNVSFYYVSTIVLYRGLLSAEVFVFLIYIISFSRKRHFRLRDIGSFLFRGEKISLLALQGFFSFLGTLFFLYRLLVFRNQILAHPWVAPVIAVLATLVLFFLSFFALFSAEEYISLQDIRLAFRFNYRKETKGQRMEELMEGLLEDAEDEALTRLRIKLFGEEETEGNDTDAERDKSSIAKDIFAAMAASWDEDSMLSRFENLMLKEQLFLQPRLSLNEVAERLHTNKTYVSKLVNNTFNLGFPELINTLRIDYAEQYILKHRDAKQTEIAAACGFLSVSSFNNTFKKVTGITPKVWIASKEMQL